MKWLALKTPELPLRPDNPALDESTLQTAQTLIDEVRSGGECALRRLGERFGDVTPAQPLIYTQSDLKQALHAVSPQTRRTLNNAARRIETFAKAQRAAIQDFTQEIPGGQTGLRYQPVGRAGCYAPGGRFPLPSSVLMTVCTARAAGVSDIWVASPRPQPVTLAAAAVAGANGLIAVGGAQAIGALAYGAGRIPACAAIVGPGNRWVTAAKKCVSGTVAIDMLAGPSELLVIADDSADPERVAADLLAQAEHDSDAVPVLICLDDTLPSRVDAAIERQLQSLPTAAIAIQAFTNGWYAITTRAQAIILANAFAPEHLSLQVNKPESWVNQLTEVGALFVGDAAAEVLGDYGAGPNHTLPTGGAARSFGALSVMDFLRAQTWIKMDNLTAARGILEDTVALARLEGLEAHARSAEARQSMSGSIQPS